MQAPGGPTVAPPSAPNGPMIPAPAGSLPPMAPPGGVGMKAPAGGVQQTAYQIGSDGQARPVSVTPLGEAPVFPQTALQVPTPPPAKKMENKRRGIFDGWFGK
jgi:hypothetical protein